MANNNQSKQCQETYKFILGLVGRVYLKTFNFELDKIVSSLRAINVPRVFKMAENYFFSLTFL